MEKYKPHKCLLMRELWATKKMSEDKEREEQINLAIRARNCPICIRRIEVFSREVKKRK